MKLPNLFQDLIGEGLASIVFVSNYEHTLKTLTTAARYHHQNQCGTPFETTKPDDLLGRRCYEFCKKHEIPLYE